MDAETKAAVVAIRANARLREYVERVVSAAPPLSDSQRERLGTLLSAAPAPTLPALREVLHG